MATDAVRKAHADGQRLREAGDTEYRAARRDGTWGRAEPQLVELWRAAVRAWTLAVEAALGPEPAALGRFRAAPPAAADPTPAGESATWIELRDALARKLSALARLLEERGTPGGGGAPPPSPFRKR